MRVFFSVRYLVTSSIIHHLCLTECGSVVLVDFGLSTEPHIDTKQRTVLGVGQNAQGLWKKRELSHNSRRNAVLPDDVFTPTRKGELSGLRSVCIEQSDSYCSLGLELRRRHAQHQREKVP